MSIVKLVFFVIIGIFAFILLWELAEFIYKKSDAYKNSLADVLKFIDEVPFGLDICNIGSGPGVYAISYEDCPLKGFNFSTAPQNYKYGFRILDQYKNNINNGAIIIIIMCPLSFANNLDYQKPDYSDKYYYFLDKDKIDRYSTFRDIIIHNPLLYRILKKGKNIINSINSNIQNQKSTNEKEFNLNEYELNVIKEWEREFNLYDLKDASQSINHCSAFQEKINILCDGIHFCRKQNWQPILVIPPIPKETKQYISSSFLQEFVYQNLQKVSEGVGGIRIIDYFNDRRFEEDKYYRNDIFMNEYGMKNFSNVLFHDVLEVN